jgi:hypothetical protein
MQHLLLTHFCFFQTELQDIGISIYVFQLFRRIINIDRYVFFELKELNKHGVIGVSVSRDRVTNTLRYHIDCSLQEWYVLCYNRDIAGAS